MQPRRARHIKDHGAEAALFRRRALAGFLVALAGLGGLAGWYFRLQVLRHDEFATRSEANRLRLVPVAPARGLIYDRKGRILADNVSAWRLDAVPERAGDGALLLARLQAVVALDEEQRARFLRDYKASRPFKAVTVKLRVSDEEAARFAVERWRFPGVELVPYLGREYPYGALFAHVVGYVGRIDEKDQAAMGDAGGAYSHTGKTGLERYYEQQLRGKPGYRRLETNVDGRTVRTLDTVPATPGTDLRLSIDAELQPAMVDAFGELEGTAVAVDPRTAQVEVLRFLTVEDVGRAINPMIVHGQSIGASFQGISGTFLDEFVYDEYGQLLTGSFADYVVATATDFPRVESITLEVHKSPTNPLGGWTSTLWQIASPSG